MIILSWILGVVGSILLAVASIAFFRAKDVFVMIQIAALTNFYVTPLILLAIEFEKFSGVSMIKTIIIITLNIVITNILTYIIAKRAAINKVSPDADFKDIVPF